LSAKGNEGPDTVSMPVIRRGPVWLPMKVNNRDGISIFGVLFEIQWLGTGYENQRLELVNPILSRF
jgi:hypothetical protein